MKLNTIVTILSFILMVSGCDGCFTKKEVKNELSIKIGVMAGPETELMEKIKEVARDEHGLTITIVQFNDYMTPNIALNDKSIDANSFQHEPYLKEMVKQRGFKIMAAGRTFIYPLAAYSKKIHDNKDIPKNAKVAIPNDPTNEARALLLMQKQGLIVLKDSAALSQIQDIVQNPFNLKIVELEAAQLPRVLDDVDFAIINTTFAKAAGLSPLKQGLFYEDGDSAYVNIVAIRQEDKDAPWVKKLMASIQNERIIKAAEEIFAGSAAPGWNKGDVDDGLRDD